MSSLGQLTEQLRPNETIQNFINQNEHWSEKRGQQLHVTARFIVTQTLLHLPYYPEEEISSSSEAVLADIDPKIVQIAEDFGAHYGRLHTASSVELITSEAKLKGRNMLHIADGLAQIPVTFKPVPAVYAHEIQNQLHYIRAARTDNDADFGLHISDADFPYAYTSFSRCKRGYQVNALNEASGLSLEPEEVFSMTRAFSFDNAPLNSMSKLFHLSRESLRKKFPDCRAIVTALNPYLGFRGGIFTGSSYFPYALSPMEYWYDESGAYVPRSRGIVPQKSVTPPIVWLAHGVDNTASKSIENITKSSIKTISSAEYNDS